MIPGTFHVDGALPPPALALTDVQAPTGSTSFSGVNFGPEDSTRFMVLCVTTSWLDNSHGALTSATIGGVSAGGPLSAGYPGAFCNTCIFGAAVPSGTTGSISLGGSTSHFYELSFSIYSIRFLRSTTPFDARNFNASAAGNSSVSINVPVNGVLIASNSTQNPSSFGTPGFSGVTRDYVTKWNQQITFPNYNFAHESGSLTTATALSDHGVASTNVSSSANGLAAVSFG